MAEDGLGAAGELASQGGPWGPGLAVGVQLQHSAKQVGETQSCLAFFAAAARKGKTKVMTAVGFGHVTDVTAELT